MATNTFISPPQYDSNTASDYAQNMVYTLDDQTPITWVTNYESYYFQLYQEVPALNAANNGTKIFSTSYPPSNPNEVQSFNWTVSIYPFSLSYYPVFYIQCDNMSGSPLFMSQPFNITAAQTSSSSSSSTSSPTTLPLDASPSANTAKSGGSTVLSTGAQAGIGIAVALLGLGLIAAALVIGYRRGRKCSKQIIKGDAGEDMGGMTAPGSSHSSHALRSSDAVELYTPLDDTKQRQHLAYARKYQTAPQPLQDLKPPPVPHASPLRVPKSRYIVRSPEPGVHEVEGSEAPVRRELP